MFKKSDAAKIELIEKYITDIEKMIKRHGAIDQLLDDFEGEYAVLMCITLIAEIISKITSTEIQGSINIRGITGFRHRIIHNDEGRDKTIISAILSKDIPELKRVIENLLKKINENY